MACAADARQILYRLLFGLNNKQVPCRLDDKARSLYRFMAPLRRGQPFDTIALRGVFYCPFLYLGGVFIG